MNDDAAAAAFATAYGGFVLICVVIFGLISIVANWQIVSKAGYSGALSLLLLIPLVGYVFYLIFAFSKWPVQKQMDGEH